MLKCLALSVSQSPAGWQGSPTGASSSVSEGAQPFPLPLLCSLSVIFLYCFFSDLILLRHCLPMQWISYRSNISEVSWNTVSFLYDPDSCAWVTSPDQISNRVFILASCHIAPLSTMFIQTTLGQKQDLPRFYIWGRLAQVEGNQVESRFETHFWSICSDGSCEAC